MKNDTYVPSELLLFVLPSVDSLLPCLVTRFLISTAIPVSVLRRILLRSFFVVPSVKSKIWIIQYTGCYIFKELIRTVLEQAHKLKQ